jgi:hypothetical protein
MKKKNPPLNLHEKVIISFCKKEAKKELGKLKRIQAAEFSGESYDAGEAVGAHNALISVIEFITEGD